MASGGWAPLFGPATFSWPASSQDTHFNSVRPFKPGIGTILFPQCKQCVTRSMATSRGCTNPPEEPRFHQNVAIRYWSEFMQEIIDHVMRTYGVMI
jgi:hypothetical protein